MDSTSEKAEANRFLEGLLSGQMATQDALKVAETLDPVYVYFTIRYLREVHGEDDNIGEAVLNRIVELTNVYDSIVQLCKKGEQDPITEWFDDSYSLKQFRKNPEEMIDLLDDKINS